MIREDWWSLSSSRIVSSSLWEKKGNNLSNWLATDLAFFILFCSILQSSGHSTCKTITVYRHPSTMIPYDLLWQDVCLKLSAQSKSHSYFISAFESSFKYNFYYRNKKGQSLFLININRSRCKNKNIIEKIPVKSEYLTFAFIKSSTV